MYVHPRHRPLYALVRWVRSLFCVAILSIASIQVSAQSRLGYPDAHLLNNTPGEREFLFMRESKTLGMWYVRQEKGTHVVQVCHGQHSPVSLNLGEHSALVLSYAGTIDTLQHAMQYKGALRGGTFTLNDEQWERLLTKQLVTATIVNGHGTLVSAVTKAEADMLNSICAEVDNGPP